MISNIRYWFLLFLVLLVYVAGMFVTLFENDSARSAVFAMRMVQENDYLNFLVGSEPYFDKPNIHLWLSAFSFKIFGFYDWAYRIPAILASILGAYSCFGLGRLLYNLNVGKLAALVFMTSQIIFFSNIDVITNALLTGFSIFALWQLTRYIEKNSFSGIILGALGAGLAFSSQGIIALLIVGLPLLCHVAYTRKWKGFFSFKVLIALILFAIVITPICYVHYLHLEVQPEKVGGSKNGIVDIFMLFFEKGFEHLKTEGINRSDSGFFFFSKTFLWAFLPWTIIGILAYFSRMKSFIRLSFKYISKYEFLTIGGISLLFLFLIFSGLNLGQHLNPIIPLFSILTASYLYSLYRFRKTNAFKGLLGIQFFVLGAIFIASVLLCYFVFKTGNPLNYIWKIVLTLMAIFYSLKREHYYFRIITVSVLGSLMLNAVLNTHFFPELLKFQAGSSMAKIVAEKEIPIDNIYKLSGQQTWALDFYNKEPVKQISINKILNKKNIWVYSSELQLRELNNLGYDWDRQYQTDQFKIENLQTKFLDPSTRKNVLDKMYLIHIY